jgi:two-component system, LytTR family, response regulator
MTPPLRTLIVDDERLARKRLRSLLAAHPEVVVVGEAATVAEAAACAALERPDLVLLDVQMPPATGFDLLPLLPAPAPAIVFTTAHDAFAVRAFEISAADYLLKPLLPERLAAALARVREARSRTVPSARPNTWPALMPEDALILTAGDRVRRVALAEIAAVAAEGHYTRVHLAAEPAMFLSRGIADWAAQLPAPGFLRADRSLIVNLSRVRGLEVRSRDLARLTLDAVGSPLELGRAASARLRAALGL